MDGNEKIKMANNKMNNDKKQSKTKGVYWEELMRLSFFCIERMPQDACPSIVLITDGLLSMEINKTSSYGGVPVQCVRKDVGLSTLQASERHFIDNTPFGNLKSTFDFYFFIYLFIFALFCFFVCFVLTM